jgi:hypothetical protein
VTEDEKKWSESDDCTVALRLRSDQCAAAETQYRLKKEAFLSRMAAERKAAEEAARKTELDLSIENVDRWIRCYGSHSQDHKTLAILKRLKSDVVPFLRSLEQNSFYSDAQRAQAYGGFLGGLLGPYAQPLTPSRAGALANQLERAI